MADLPELQSEIVAERAAGGITTDPVRVLALLVEETGEVAPRPEEDLVAQLRPLEATG